MDKAHSIPAKEQAKMLIKLWGDSCAKYFNDPQRLRSFAKENNLRENPSYAHELLSGRPGTVWDASVGDLAQFSVVLFEDGSSQALAQNADAVTIGELFERVVRQIKIADLTVEEFVNKDVPTAGRQVHQRGFFLRRADQETGWSFVLTTSPIEASGGRAVITIARSRTPGQGNA